MPEKFNPARPLRQHEQKLIFRSRSIHFGSLSSGMLIRLFAFLCGCVSVFAAGEKSSLAIDLGHSRVEILVKATMDSFTGRLEKFTPSVSLDDLGRVVEAQVHFEFADIKTGKEKRDRAMNEWQQTEKFPDGEFALISLSPGTTDQATVQGRLTFHGVTRSLEFPVSVVSDHSLYSIDGQVEIDTRNFDLPIIRVMGVLKVDPLVTVRFHLQGAKGK